MPGPVPPAALLLTTTRRPPNIRFGSSMWSARCVANGSADRDIWNACWADQESNESSISFRLHGKAASSWIYPGLAIRFSGSTLEYGSSEGPHDRQQGGFSCPG